MGVYVILDGVRREYPEAHGWKQNEHGALIIYKVFSQNLYGEISQYGRYDLVGWMEDEK